MSSSIPLSERLAQHPQLEKRVSELMDVVEAESGHLDRADQAEDAVIKHLRGMGNELLTEWGAHKENQKFQDACEHHPKAKARKKTLIGLAPTEK